tara:strand:- start:564 stop:899 length:336 start_codon:yes stop_codon:yes gene_type:complete
MSGSDSGVGGGIGSGPFGGRSAACNTLAIETMLSSPKPDVIEQLSVGDRLEIELLQLGGIEKVVACLDGQHAGGLVQQADRVKSCIEQGFSFQAEVRDINGARVTVFVSCR